MDQKDEKSAGKPQTKKPSSQSPRSLQRKLARVRKDIGGTEFQNLQQFFQKLVPLLDARGLTFRVALETPSRVPRDGESLYYSTDRSVQPAAWLYEADLQCTWANTDNQKDTENVLLHAVGTSFASPETARDAAWLRCIGRYLLQTFFCWQKSDSAACTPSLLYVQMPELDMQAPGGSEKASSLASNQQAGFQTTQSSRTATQKLLSDAQISRMYRKGEDAGLDKASVNAWILKNYRQQDPHHLTRAQYDEACRTLDASAAARNGGRANV